MGHVNTFRARTGRPRLEPSSRVVSVRCHCSRSRAKGTQIFTEAAQTMIVDRFDDSIPVLIDRAGYRAPRNRAGNDATESLSPPMFAARRIANSADSMRVASAKGPPWVEIDA
jgi:hypothetical protein